jgi:hypothetical protein
MNNDFGLKVCKDRFEPAMIANIAGIYLPTEVLQVLGSACAEIINGDYMMHAIAKKFSGMRANESGTTGE